MLSRFLKLFVVLMVLLSFAVISGCDSDNVLGTGGSISGSGK